MTANSRQFDRRFWKVLAVTLTQVLILLCIVLTLVYFLLPAGALKAVLYQALPPACAGLGIKLAMDKLR